MKNIIFDFNGTLYQDTEMHRRAWHAFMNAHGLTLTDEAFHRYMCGPPNSDILRRFISPDLTDGEIEALADEKEALYRAIVRSDPALQTLTPGAPEMLDALKARGVPYAVATGSAKGNVDFYFDTLNIGRWFDYRQIFYAEGRLPGKPDPTIYRLTLQKMGFDPAETLVVEDAMPGIRSAIGAGIHHIAAIDTTLGADAFENVPEVRRVIHDFRGFAEILENMA